MRHQTTNRIFCGRNHPALYVRKYPLVEPANGNQNRIWHLSAGISANEFTNTQLDTSTALVPPPTRPPPSTQQPLAPHHDSPGYRQVSFTPPLFPPLPLPHNTTNLPQSCTDRSPLTGHISFQKTKANVKIAGLLALTLTLSTLALYTLLSPAAPTNPLSPIKHVVIFMQENRAYDHYFGTLSGLRGYNDRATTPVFGLDAFHQPTSNVTDEYMLPFLAEKDKTNAMCMPAPEMYYPTDIRMWNKGRQDRWNTERDPGLGMSYFDRQGLPFYYTLFDNFVAGDQYFQSTFTSTTPNRMMLFSGSNGLSVGEFATEDNTEPVPGFDWPTIGELLEEKGVSWKVYQEADNFDDNGFAWHANFQKSVAGDILFDKGMHRYSSAITEFANDVESATLPSVSWIIAPRPFSEHATAHPAAGEDFTSRLLTALQGNPDVYKETAFILNYDEGGQFYDHARAPTPPLDASQGVSTVDVEGEVNRDALIEGKLPREGEKGGQAVERGA